MKYYLAQLNLAKAKAEMDTKVMHGFFSRLEEINALADKANGFIWRLQSSDGDSTSFRVFPDPLQLVNMSVWENIDDLKEYVYKSMHVELIRDREAWFDKFESVHQVLWWVPKGHIPTLDEGKERLELLGKNGVSKQAFTFGKPFESPKD